MEKFEISLDGAKKGLDSANHMINITFPVVKENRFLIKIFEEIYASMVSLVRAILQYEYLYKRISLYQDAESNFETFTECAEKYGIPKDYVSQIKKIFLLMKKHKESPMEFVKKDKFVILSDNLRTESITAEILKNYCGMARDILTRAEVVFSQKD